MKKIIGSLLVLVCISTAAFAANVSVQNLEMKIGIKAYMNGIVYKDTSHLIPQLIENPATLIIDFQDKYTVEFGYTNQGIGKDRDAISTLLIGGTYYMLNNQDMKYGPSVKIVTGSCNDPAKSNNVTIFVMGGTAKKLISSNLAITADLTLYGMASGKIAGVKIEDANVFLPSISIGLVFYLL